MAANRRRMRNRSLHEALRAFTEQAALTLDAETHAGAEIPFEVVESPGRPRGAVLLPPADRRVHRRAAPTRSSGCPATSPRCARSRGSAASTTTSRRAARRACPRIPASAPTRRCASFLASVYDEASEFAFDRTRFGRAYRELESVVYEGRTLSTLVVPVHGLELDSAEVVLAEGFALARGDTLPEVPPEAVWDGLGRRTSERAGRRRGRGPGDRRRRRAAAPAADRAAPVRDRRRRARPRRLGAHGRRPVARGAGRRAAPRRGACRRR